MKKASVPYHKLQDTPKNRYDSRVADLNGELRLDLNFLEHQNTFSNRTALANEVSIGEGEEVGDVLLKWSAFLMGPR